LLLSSKTSKAATPKIAYEFTKGVVGFSLR